MSTPCFAMLSSVEALSWKIAAFLASQMPQMWISGNAFRGERFFVFNQFFQASSKVCPCQTIFVLRRDWEEFHIWVVKGQAMNRCVMFSSSFLQREHQLGPSKERFFHSVPGWDFIFQGTPHKQLWFQQTVYLTDAFFAPRRGSPWKVMVLKCWYLVLGV